MVVKLMFDYSCGDCKCDDPLGLQSKCPFMHIADLLEHNGNKQLSLTENIGKGYRQVVIKGEVFETYGNTLLLSIIRNNNNTHIDMKIHGPNETYIAGKIDSYLESIGAEPVSLNNNKTVTSDMW